jgi:hypothetical protein
MANKERKNPERDPADDDLNHRLPTGIADAGLTARGLASGRDSPAQDT